MMVFLFISVAIVVQINNIARNYKHAQQGIAGELHAAFEKDMARWGADINDDKLSIYFVRADVQFDTDSSTVKPEFKATLAEFFPRYKELIKKHKDMIQEVRIEGYTDSTGGYFYNMKLSQDRARSVLQYCLTLPTVTHSDFDELKDLITANGLSFSHTKQNDTGGEDKEASRRVEFRILTNAEAEIEKIIGTQQ